MKNHRHLPLLAQLLILTGSILLAWTAATMITFSLSLVGLNITDSNVMLVTQGISQLIIFMVPSLLFVHLFHRGEDYLRYTGGIVQWKQVGLGLLALLLLTPAVDTIGQWNKNWHLGEQLESLETLLRNTAAQAEAVTEQLLTMPHCNNLIWVLLIIALIPAVCEEILFRGIIQHSLQRHRYNIHIAVWTTALLFSICHGDFFALLPRLLLGALLGYLYAYSHSLLVNSIVHFFNNAIAIVHYYLFQHNVVQLSPTESIEPTIVLSLCCTAAAVFLIVEIARIKNKACSQ